MIPAGSRSSFFVIVASTFDSKNYCQVLNSVRINIATRHFPKFTIFSPTNLISVGLNQFLHFIRQRKAFRRKGWRAQQNQSGNGK